MASTMHIIREIDHEFLLVAMRSDGIVTVYIKSHTEINITLQKDMIKIYNELTGGKKAVFLFEAGEFVSITKEARSYAIRMEKDTPTYASAILVKNLGHKIIADFYYKVNRPKQPYRIFWHKDKAIEWLKEMQVELQAKHDDRQYLNTH
jgi:hypothetical protein